LKSIDFRTAFRSLGYTWTDNSIIQPSHIKWYKFDPNSIKFTEEEVGLHATNGLQNNSFFAIICTGWNSKELVMSDHRLDVLYITERNLRRLHLL